MPVGRQVLDATTWRCRLDRNGKARLRVHPGFWSLIVTDRCGFVRWTGELGGLRPLDLQLSPMPVVRGRVLGANGDVPVRLTFGGASLMGMTPPEPSATLRAVGQRLNHWFVECARVEADGAFELPFLDVPDAEYSAHAVCGERAAPFYLRVGEKPVELTLRSR